MEVVVEGRIQGRHGRISLEEMRFHGRLAEGPKDDGGEEGLGGQGPTTMLLERPSTGKSPP